MVIDIAKQYCFNDSGKCFYQFNLVANKKTDATVIVALYDDNYRMLDILTKNLQLSSEAKSISERPTVSNATKYKVFVWENLSNLTPLCEAFEGKVE